MPQLYVHLAPPEAMKAQGRAAALAEVGLWHRVASYENQPGEVRLYDTDCGITQPERPDRMDEADHEPGGARCPKCFTKKGK